MLCPGIHAASCGLVWSWAEEPQCLFDVCHILHTMCSFLLWTKLAPVLLDLPKASVAIHGIVNGISKISVSSSFLVFGNTVHFHIFTLYPTT